MIDSGLMYRVVGWDETYETRQTLKRKGPLSELKVGTNLGTAALQGLLRSPDGAAVLGVWYVIQVLAANADRRGVLCERGVPLTPQELARVTGWDVPLIDRALAVLCQPDIRLLEQVPIDVALQPPVIPAPRPRQPRKPKPPPFTHCPVCNVDLVAYAEETSGCACHDSIHRVQASPDVIAEVACESQAPSPEARANNPRVQGRGEPEVIETPHPVADAASVREKQVAVLDTPAGGLCDDDQGRRAELRRLAELTPPLTAHRVEPLTVAEHLGRHPSRLERTAAGCPQPTPSQKSRSDNRLPPGRRKRKAMHIKQKQGR